MKPSMPQAQAAAIGAPRDTRRASRLAVLKCIFQAGCRPDAVAASLLLSYLVAALAARWSEYHPSSRALAVVIVCAFAGYLLIQRSARYRRHRTFLVLAMKAALFLARSGGKLAVHVQVRLNNPPTGTLLQDMLAAALGLRLFWVALAGLQQLRWSMWVVLQAASVLRSWNLEQDCKTPLLSNSLMAERTSHFHEVMSFCATLLLEIPLVASVVPKTELGRCKAAVCFWSILLGFLLPAVLLVSEQPMRTPQEAPDLCSGLDGWIERRLRALRLWHGNKLGAVWWGLLLLLLWLATASAF